MNPPSITSSSTIEDPESFVEALQKVFEVLHVANAERVEIVAYQLKNVSRTWFDQWKEGRPRRAPHVEEEKVSDIEGFRRKKAKTGSESGQQRNNVNQSSFQQKKKGPDPLSACSPAPRNKGKYRDGSTCCFKCGEEGHFMKEWPNNRQGNGDQGNKAQSSSVSPPDKVALRGATSGTGGGANHHYAITSCQEQENYPYVFTVLIKVFNLDVYAFLD
ncbi:uncharacterized protein LOC107009879 [Solanum pennellii]|uniref:Uncharacterized protein LOC107009879 n=1 Tax=Solanum pennellii TaxID=28526 RepID=A0ABM1G1M3_SOLPN|nr:uncharacterized protein LOC107009879 [Solanum pennellii]